MADETLSPETVETKPAATEPAVPDYATWAEAREREVRGDEPKPAAAETPAEGETAADPEEAARASAAGKELAAAKNRGEKRKQSIQAEIDDLTTRKYNVRRDVEAEEARLVALRQEMTALGGKVAETSKPAAPVADAPKPKVADFETYEDFVEALSDWKADQKATARAAEVEKKIDAKLTASEKRREADAQAGSQQVVIAQHNARMDAARKAHPDFDSVLAAQADILVHQAIGEVIPFSPVGAEVMYHLAKNPAVAETLVDLPISLPMRDAIMDSALAPKMLSYLAAHPDECQRLSILPPKQALVAMGKLESRLDVAPTGPTSAAAPVTRAPAPIKPVGSSATATTVSLTELAQQNRGREFIERRDREERERRMRRA